MSAASDEQRISFDVQKEHYNNFADEIGHLRELKQEAMVENAEREGLKQRITEM